jgi:hypothetical protein
VAWLIELFLLLTTNRFIIFLQEAAWLIKWYGWFIIAILCFDFSASILFTTNRFIWSKSTRISSQEIASNASSSAFRAVLPLIRAVLNYLGYKCETFREIPSLILSSNPTLVQHLPLVFHGQSSPYQVRGPTKMK